VIVKVRSCAALVSGKHSTAPASNAATPNLIDFMASLQLRALPQLLFGRMPVLRNCYIV
jgi:hypothetical protein